jgi:phosphatidyl-myo-inositol dimannoside synthase
MRILALLTDGLGAGGGIAYYNSNLMAALGGCGCVDQVLALPRFGDAAVPRPQRVVQLAAVSGASGWAAKAAFLSLSRRVDSIFCGHLNAAPFAAAVARFAGKPLWIQVHGIEAWEDRGPSFRNALASARLVTSVSRYTRRRLLEWCDLESDRVRVLPNTISVPFRGRGDRPAELASRLGLQQSRVILTVGRLSAAEHYKGHDRIISVLKEVGGMIPSVSYLIVGSGDDRVRLEKLAFETGVSDRVIIVPDVRPSELNDYFQLADVFAMPSTGEGFGIVYLEAAAAGLPVIAGNRDGSADALADGRGGCLIDPECRAQLVGALVAGLEGRLPAGSNAMARFEFMNFARHVERLVSSHFQ